MSFLHGKEAEKRTREVNEKKEEYFVTPLPHYPLLRTNNFPNLFSLCLHQCLLQKTKYFCKKLLFLFSSNSAILRGLAFINEMFDDEYGDGYWMMMMLSDGWLGLTWLTTGTQCLPTRSTQQQSTIVCSVVCVLLPPPQIDEEWDFIGCPMTPLYEDDDDDDLIIMVMINRP